MAIIFFQEAKKKSGVIKTESNNNNKNPPKMRNLILYVTDILESGKAKMKNLVSSCPDLLILIYMLWRESKHFYLVIP